MMIIYTFQGNTFTIERLDCRDGITAMLHYADGSITEISMVNIETIIALPKN